MSFQRWPDKPNKWPEGERVRRSRGLLGRLFGRPYEYGIIQPYVYASGSTMVTIKWEDGEEEYGPLAGIGGWGDEP